MNKTISKSIFLLLIPGVLLSLDIPNLTISKLSPDLQIVFTEKSSRDIQIIDSPLSRVRTVKGPADEILYPVTINSVDIEAVKAAGINTNSDFPGFSTARVNAEQLLVLSELDEVDKVFQGDLLYALNDLAVSHSGADLAHEGYITGTNSPYDGTGVIVVIIDTGIDWTHLDFRDPSDPTKSRILYIWDQTLTPTGSEVAPSGNHDGTFSGLTDGVEYTKSQIDAALLAGPPGDVRTTDSNGHGTEVAGSAVGNGASLSTRQYKGMAPAADIVVVRAGQSTTFDNQDVLDAVNYAKLIADETGKPVVVNLSLGSQTHAHDGTASLDRAVDVFTTNGTAPGRVAVVAAGNAGNENIHAEGSVSAGDSTAIEILVPDYTVDDPHWPGANNDYFQIEIWWSSAGYITTRVISPNGYYNQKVHDTAGSVQTADGYIYLFNNYDSDHNNNHRWQTITVKDLTADVGPEQGTWTIKLINASGGEMTYHAWLYASSKGPTSKEGATLTSPVGNANYTIASPGVANSAITVGAYSARWKWYSNLQGAGFGFSGTDLSDDIAYFSSIGPALDLNMDDRQKPDICVPGRGLISTTSTGNPPATEPDSAKTITDNKYILTEGTSGASGVVSGAAALLLDKDATLTAAEVKSYITANADADGYTGTVPNVTWGYGKLNIFKSIAAALGSATWKHKIYAHDAWDDATTNLIDNTVKEAVKFTASQAGEITGALFFTGQTIPGSGSVSFEIWTDVSGLPSTKVGSTVTMNCADMGKYTWNYVSLKDIGVNILASEKFHLVLNNTSGSTISLRKSTSSISNNSSNDLGGGWAALTDRDWRLRAVVSNKAAVTTSGLIDTSLPVELAFFNASTVKGQMVLKWATESETENLGFMIERRKSGTDDWKFISDHTKDKGLQGQGSTSSRTDYIYYDKKAKPGLKYDYRLTDIPYTSAYTPTSIVLEDIEFRIAKFALHKNYPNPFNPATTISYELSDYSDVQVKIFDVNGREVQSWDHNGQEAGYYEMVWAGVNHSGRPVSAGLYLLSVQAGNNLQTRKLLLLK